jgi:hypothetical protein
MRRKQVLYKQVYLDNGRRYKTVCTTELVFAESLHLITFVISVIIIIIIIIIITISVSAL